MRADGVLFPHQHGRDEATGAKAADCEPKPPRTGRAAGRQRASLSQPCSWVAGGEAWAEEAGPRYRASLELDGAPVNGPNCRARLTNLAGRVPWQRPKRRPLLLGGSLTRD